MYGAVAVVRADDRTLRHLQVVIQSKLRRDEGLSFSWTEYPGEDARYHDHVIWISKASALYFVFDDPADQPVNSAWLRMLTDAANSNSGLRPLPEPAGLSVVV